MAKPTLSSKTGTGAKLLQYAETVLAKTTENASIFRLRLNSSGRA